MTINDISLSSPQLLDAGSTLNYSFLHVLRINRALPHLLYPSFQVLNGGICIAHSFLCVLQLFLHFIGKRQVDYYVEYFGGHSSFTMNLFARNCFTFF